MQNVGPERYLQNFFLPWMIYFHDWIKSKCNMRVSLSPFSSRLRTPLQRYVSSQYGQTKNVKSFSIFHVVEWHNWNLNPRVFAYMS